PVADLGGAMKDVVGALNSATQRVGIAKVAAHHLGDTVEEGGIRAGADQRPDAQAARRAGLGEMTAHKSRSAGDQAECGHEHPWVRASVSLPFLRGERRASASAFDTFHGLSWQFPNRSTRGKRGSLYSLRGPSIVALALRVRTLPHAEREGYDEAWKSDIPA